MKPEEQDKQLKLKVLKDITKKVMDDEITDFVVLGYGNRKTQGGVFADPIVGYGLIKRLEREIPSSPKAYAIKGLDNLFEYLSGDDD